MSTSHEHASVPIATLDGSVQDALRQDPLACAFRRMRFLGLLAELDLRIRVLDPSFIVMPRLGALL